MKEKVIICALALTVAALASASGWRIAYSYAAPANARGICLNAPFDYSILCDGSPPRIYDRNFPSRYISLDVPSGVWGLTIWMAGAITVSNYNNSYIYHLTSTGSVISSFRCPRDHPADLATWGKFVAIPNENLALELTTGGSVISSFRGPGSRLTALEGENPGQYIIGDPATHKVYFAGYGELNLSAPAAIWADIKTADERITDQYEVLDSSTNYIYTVRWVGPEATEPASLGRVKALYK
jgi:hypothetical protein